MSLDLSRSIGLSRHADLKTRDEGCVLLLPERAIRIGGSGAEILGLVAEDRTVGSVLDIMRERYPNSAPMGDEVLGFLEEMLGLGGLVELDEQAEKRS